MSNTRLGLYITGGVLGLVTLLVVLFFATNLFSQHTANFRGETNKRNAVEANGHYRIAAYDHFHDLCAAVQTDKQVIANTQQSLKTASDERKQELSTFLLAQRNALANDVNQYNTDAHKSYTQGQFRSSDLPFELFVKGETHC